MRRPVFFVGSRLIHRLSIFALIGEALALSLIHGKLRPRGLGWTGLWGDRLSELDLDLGDSPVFEAGDVDRIAAVANSRA